MNQLVIDRFNAATAVNDTAFEKAQAAGFPWMYFITRAENKARACGYLPESGCLVFAARYTNSADKVVDGVFASWESIGDAHSVVGWFVPWLDNDLQRWKELICSVSCTLFDAGVVAAFTRAYGDEEDPLLKNGAASIMGDVGFMGLRQKVISIVKEVGGNQVVELLGEIGDCACLHKYADKLNSEQVFRLNGKLREAYVRNACKAAYIAGAVFGEKIRG